MYVALVWARELPATRETQCSQFSESQASAASTESFAVPNATPHRFSLDFVFTYFVMATVVAPTILGGSPYDYSGVYGGLYGASPYYGGLTTAYNGGYGSLATAYNGGYYGASPYSYGGYYGASPYTNGYYGASSYLSGYGASPYYGASAYHGGYPYARHGHHGSHGRVW